jgi:hypothetical protein
MTMWSRNPGLWLQLTQGPATLINYLASRMLQPIFRILGHVPWADNPGCSNQHHNLKFQQPVSGRLKPCIVMQHRNDYCRPPVPAEGLAGCLVLQPDIWQSKWTSGTPSQENVWISSRTFGAPGGHLQVTHMSNCERIDVLHILVVGRMGPARAQSNVGVRSM